MSGEKDGIVYVKMGAADDTTANIGTLVNGAGLAMNTVDALRATGGRAPRLARHCPRLLAGSLNTDEP